MSVFLGTHLSRHKIIFRHSCYVLLTLNMSPESRQIAQRRLLDRPPLVVVSPTSDLIRINALVVRNIRMVRITATLHRHVMTTPYSTPLHTNDTANRPILRLMRRRTITSKVRLLGYSHAYDIIKEQIATVQTKHSFNPTRSQDGLGRIQTYSYVSDIL